MIRGEFVKFTYSQEDGDYGRLTGHEKMCCPLTAVLVTRGFDPMEFGKPDSEWIKVIDEVFESSTEEESNAWNYIWRGYDSHLTTEEALRGNGATRDPLFLLGVELKELFPPINPR